MTTAARSRTPGMAYWIAPLLGLAWNAFGLTQFVSAGTADRDHLVAMGMTPDQAALYAGLPAWMTAAFAIGVLGGLAGCLLLGLRRKAAVPMLAVSLAAYIVLYAGDITEGLFAAFGLQQVAILSMVVLAAVALFLFGAGARKRGILA